MKTESGFSTTWYGTSSPVGYRITSERRATGPASPAWADPRTSNGRPFFGCWRLLSGTLALLDHRRHGSRGRGDVSRIRPVVERRLLAREGLRLLHELGVIIDESSAQPPGAEVGGFEDRPVVGDGRGGTDDDELPQRPAGPRDRLRAV